MKEFKSVFRMENHREAIEKDLYDVAGICEVHECHWQDLGNYHTDSVGEYKGDDLAVIPDDAEVRWTVMDAEEYAETLLANCSGCDAEDFVCEETGKVLVVQFYVPMDEE